MDDIKSRVLGRGEESVKTPEFSRNISPKKITAISAPALSLSLSHHSLYQSNLGRQWVKISRWLQTLLLINEMSALFLSSKVVGIWDDVYQRESESGGVKKMNWLGEMGGKIYVHIVLLCSARLRDQRNLLTWYFSPSKNMINWDEKLRGFEVVVVVSFFFLLPCPYGS